MSHARLQFDAQGNEVISQDNGTIDQGQAARAAALNTLRTDDGTFRVTDGANLEQRAPARTMIMPPLPAGYVRVVVDGQAVETSIAAARANGWVDESDKPLQGLSLQKQQNQEGKQQPTDSERTQEEQPDADAVFAPGDHVDVVSSLEELGVGLDAYEAGVATGLSEVLSTGNIGPHTIAEVSRASGRDPADVEACIGNITRVAQAAANRILREAGLTEVGVNGFYEEAIAGDRERLSSAMYQALALDNGTALKQMAAQYVAKIKRITRRVE